MKELEWVEIESFLNQVEATVAKSFLEGEGISCQIRSDDIAATRPHLGALSGVKLYVQKEDVEEAKALLKSTFEEG